MWTLPETFPITLRSETAVDKKVLNIYHHFIFQNIDSKFFKELEHMNPDNVCSRSLAEFDPEQGMYRVSEFGEPLAMGDAAFRFQILPRIPLTAVLWYGDKEFEASAKLLMDSTIQHHLPLDVIYPMSVEFIRRFVGYL